MAVGARFCSRCAHPAEPLRAGDTPADLRQAPEAERRQLTLLFCDLVDTTALASSLDAEDWREVLSAHQELATGVTDRFGGHVAQYLGEGLLVYFGWPRAHEDDAERAVRAGLEIVDAVGRVDPALQERFGPGLRARVGIHTGPVVVGETGGGGRTETLAFGDTTNVTARLKAEAEPDAVVLSSATLRLVQGIFVTRDLGERTLRGVGKLHLHQAIRPSGMRSRLDVAAATGLTPLVGRRQELELLEDRFARACEGLGQAVVLSGEAGIGKSRVVQTFRERLAERSHTWLEGRCSAYTRDSAFYPVLELLGRALSFRSDDSPEVTLERIETGLASADFDLAKTVPLMAALHALPQPDRYVAPVLSPEAQRRHTLELLTQWLLRLGQQQPLVLLLEDLHWMDPSTQELLGQILDRIARARVLLLVTGRIDPLAAWGARGHVTQMLLSRLTRAQIGDLVRKAARERDLPDPWVHRIARRSDGVPLFAEELTRAVLESNPGLPEGEGLRVHIPETLRDSLMSRLDELGPVKELAQLGAVLGREFSYDLLLEVSRLTQARLEPLLAEAVRRELFYQRGVPPEATYLFRHELTRDAAYQSLLRATRQRHHRRVAETLIDRFPAAAETQPELVARHLTEAGDMDRAIDHWQRAGERAARRSENAEAIRHLRRGLELLGGRAPGRERSERELELQVLIGGPLIAVEGYGSAEVGRVYERARELCRELGEAPQLTQALFGSSALYFTARAELRTALELGNRLLGLARRSGEASHLVLGHLAVGLPLFERGELTEALEHLERVMKLYDPSRDRALLASYGLDLEVVSRSWAARAIWQLGYPDRALASCREGTRHGRESPYAHSLVFALGSAAILHYMRRDPAEARRCAEEVMAISQEQGIVSWWGVGRVLRGWALADAGAREGLDEIQQAMADLGATGLRLGAPFLLCVLGDAHRSLGRSDDAIGALDAAVATAQATETRNWDSEILRIRGEILLEDPARADEGASLLHQALELAHGRRWRSLELRTAMSLAHLRRRQGRRQDANGVLQPVYARFTEGFDTPELKGARALLEELA